MRISKKVRVRILRGAKRFAKRAVRAGIELKRFRSNDYADGLWDMVNGGGTVSVATTAPVSSFDATAYEQTIENYKAYAASLEQVIEYLEKENAELLRDNSSLKNALASGSSDEALKAQIRELEEALTLIMEDLQLERGNSKISSQKVKEKFEQLRKMLKECQDANKLLKTKEGVKLATCRQTLKVFDAEEILGEAYQRYTDLHNAKDPQSMTKSIEHARQLAEKSLAEIKTRSHNTGIEKTAGFLGWTPDQGDVTKFINAHIAKLASIASAPPKFGASVWSPSMNDPNARKPAFAPGAPTAPPTASPAAPVLNAPIEPPMASAPSAPPTEPSPQNLMPIVGLSPLPSNAVPSAPSAPSTVTFEAKTVPICTIEYDFINKEDRIYFDKECSLGDVEEWAEANSWQIDGEIKNARRGSKHAGKKYVEVKKKGMYRESGFFGDYGYDSDSSIDMPLMSTWGNE